MSTTEERLRTISALIPLGSDSMNEPSIDWDNDAWLAWVDHYMNVVPNPETTYDGPHHGEYWPSYAAVAEIDGGLDAQPAEVSNRSATTTSIWDSTSDNYGLDWKGGPGDAVRWTVADVETIPVGDVYDRVPERTIHNAKIEMRLVNVDGRNFTCEDAAAMTRRCQELPAHFTVGIDHHPRCPANTTTIGNPIMAELMTDQSAQAARETTDICHVRRVIPCFKSSPRHRPSGASSAVDRCDYALPGCEDDLHAVRLSCSEADWTRSEEYPYGESVAMSHGEAPAQISQDSWDSVVGSRAFNHAVSNASKH